MTKMKKEGDAADAAPLQDRRRAAADEIEERYDYSYEVVDGCGWTHEEGGRGSDEWTKTLFFVDPENPTGNSLKGTLSVVFAPGTADPIGAQAVVDGVVVGNPMHDLKHYHEAVRS